MIAKAGQIIAIDSVLTDQSLSGDGLNLPLGINTSAVIDPISADISALSAGLGTVSGDLVDVSGKVDVLADGLLDVSGAVDTVSAGLDYVSGAVDVLADELVDVSTGLGTVSATVDTVSAALDDTVAALGEEIEARVEDVEFLSAAIDRKQEVLSAGENISIEDNTVSVSGTKGIKLHWPLFARETPDGLHIGMHDTTRRFSAEFDTTAVRNPIGGAFTADAGYRVKDNVFTVDRDISDFTMCVSYDPGLEYHPDYVPELTMTVKDGTGATVVSDHRSLDYPQTCSFATCLKNNSPYTFSLSGDTDALSGLKMKLTCVGQYIPDYGYLDELEDVYSGAGAQILVWDPEVLGVGGDRALINKDTAIGV